MHGRAAGPATADTIRHGEDNAMKLFAVRMIEDQRPVGFFWVRDMHGLLIAVDNHLDPADCEYKSIRKETAVVWPEENRVADGR